MNNNFALNLPINNLSFGQISINFLYELYKQGYQPCIFPIGPVNIGCYHFLTDDFKKWLESCVGKANRTHKKTSPTLKLWHINDGLSSISHKQILFTFHETDQLTETEQNILNNNTSVIVTSDYSKNVFESFGVNNVSKVPLGFDSNSFKILNKKYFADNVICFGLTGKLEYRKRHLDVIKLWAEKYGNNHSYILNCALFNQHLPPEVQQQLLGQAFQGKNYWNINLNPFMDRNDAFNDYLNSNSILIGMSSAEGWGLPEFQSVGLGKHAIILNGHAYKEWANSENSVLVNPNGKSDIYDNIFFHKGGEFNQGQSYTWSKEAFYEGMDQVIARYHRNKVNEAGKLLQQQFTWETTANILLNKVFELA
jgi:glycosyltransferase involved in cell wall biosynthesis